jgi:hypothetical protein
MKEDVKGGQVTTFSTGCRDHLASYKIQPIHRIRDMFQIKGCKLLRREMRRESVNVTRGQK